MGCSTAGIARTDVTLMDRLTPEQRSKLMSRIRSKDTGIERILRSALHRAGLRFRKHVSELPGRPDIVFPTARVAVYVDGDFWHGYRFGAWKDKLPPFWQEKIEKNRQRDARNRRRLRSMGWVVLRVWGHSVERNLDEVVETIVYEVRRVRPQVRN